MSVGVSGRLNQAPDRLAHEAGRENEHGREREQLQRVAERRKAVDARQHDKIERERRQIDGQVGDAAPEHVRERAARCLRHGQAAQRRSADQKRLLQDQHEGRRHDVARIAADRIEDRLQQGVGRARGGERRLDEAAIGARAARRELGGERIDRDRDAVARGPEDEQVGGIGVDRNVSRHALEHVALGAGRDADHREGLAAVDRGMCLGERIGPHRHADRAARVQGLHDALAQIAQVVVDDRDRDLAQDLAQIGLRVINAVDQRRHDQDGEGAAHSEHAPPLGRKGLADAARRGGGRRWFRPRRFAADAGRDRAQAKEREQREEHGQSRQRRERARGILQRQPACRLPEQHLHVPAQRQDRAPGDRKRVHGEDRESDPGKTECRRDDEAGEPKPGRQVAHQSCSRAPSAR